jgi:hypothetical protein
MTKIVTKIYSPPLRKCAAVKSDDNSKKVNAKLNLSFTTNPLS